MPENQTPPQPPEGLDIVHAPWLDPVTDNWKCLIQVPGFRILLYTYCPHDLRWRPDGADTTLVKELLRVAAERDELRAEVERLKKFEPKAKVIDCSKGQHDWKRVAGTDSISECQVCGMQSGK